MENRTKNVILLAMSVLPNQIRQNEFFYEEKGWKYLCESQLGPETKMILSLLNDEGKSIDRIVILETKEAREIKDNCTRVSTGEKVDKNAVDFYKEEIFAFVRGENAGKEEFYSPKIHLSEENFVDICLDDDDAILNAVRAIRGDLKCDVDLYIDVQGGIRSTTTQMNAVVELISSTNVTIKGRYANDFAPSEKGPYKIHSVDDEYRTYNLVTAMEEFRKYGRGEKLKDFFEKELIDDKDEFAIEISGTIEKAANAIKMCDVDMFDEAIWEIAQLDIAQYDERKLSPELRIIYEDIKEDYSSIIKGKYKYVEEVRWCLKKGFIQQALTIIESLMPEDFVKAKIIYFDDRDKDKLVNSQRQRKKEYVSIEHFFFDEVTDKNSYFKKNYKLSLWDELKNRYPEKTEEEIKKEVISEKDFYAIKCIEECKDRRNFSDFLYNQRYTTDTMGIDVKTMVSTNNRVDAAHLLMIHNALKRCRNMVNHSSRKMRPDTEKLVGAMKVYVELAEKVLNVE